MKKPIFIIGVAILLSTLLIPSISLPTVDHVADEEFHHTAVYDVTSTTNNTYTWFNSDFSESYNYEVPSNTTIEVQFTSLEKFNPELNISIGNLTRIGILDTEVDGNLALGTWRMPNAFGLIANTSWVAIQQEFNQLDINETSSFQTDQTYQYGSKSVSSVEVSIDDGSQSTDLIYYQDTGVLLEANITFGNFQLTFQLSEFGSQSPNKVDTLVYDILHVNESINTWYNANFSENYQYLIPSGSDIEVILDNPDDINSLLDLKLGNLTRYNIQDSEVDSNLGLGYWNMSNVFGLIANTSWSQVEVEFNQQSFISSSFAVNQVYQIGISSFQVVNVSFADSFQSTELIYDQNTGLLYYANISIGNFQLEFELSNDKIDELETDIDNTGSVIETDNSSTQDSQITTIIEPSMTNDLFNLDLTNFVYFSIFSLLVTSVIITKRRS